MKNAMISFSFCSIRWATAKYCSALETKTMTQMSVLQSVLICSVLNSVIGLYVKLAEQTRNFLCCLSLSCTANFGLEVLGMQQVGRDEKDPKIGNTFLIVPSSINKFPRLLILPSPPLHPSSTFSFPSWSHNLIIHQVLHNICNIPFLPTVLPYASDHKGVPHLFFSDAQKDLSFPKTLLLVTRPSCSFIF